LEIVKGDGTSEFYAQVKGWFHWQNLKCNGRDIARFTLLSSANGFLNNLHDITRRKEKSKHVVATRVHAFTEVVTKLQND
jgi:hypothetical protein